MDRENFVGLIISTVKINGDDEEKSFLEISKYFDMLEPKSRKAFSDWGEYKVDEKKCWLDLENGCRISSFTTITTKEYNRMKKLINFAFEFCNNFGDMNSMQQSRFFTELRKYYYGFCKILGIPWDE